MLAELLLPDQNVLTLKEVIRENAVLVVTAETKTKEANCPDCGQCSSRVHGRYRRQIADLPCTCYSLLIDLEVRRFKCTNEKCARRTFTERLPDVVRHYGRRTERLRDNQHHVALHAGGELGHRLIGPLNLTTSADTLLRLVRNGEEPEILPPRVVGIDDWAFRKGRNYGTIIIDLERQKPIDLLPDRTAETVIEWLKQYPSIEIISRDRATEYAKAATEGAPQAVQVADRWHLLKNLRDATERFLGRHSRYLKATIPVIEDPPKNEGDEAEIVPLTPAEQDSLKRRERRLALFEKVRKMHQEGSSIREIARQLEISRQLARKFAYADEFPEQAQRRRRKSKLDPYVDYLEARVETGCYSGTTLFREIKPLGFTGARTLVARWLRQKRYGPEGKAPKKATQHRPWAVARATWLFVLSPDKLKTEEVEVLERIKAVDETGQQLYELCQSFANMIREQTSSALTSWLEKTTHSNIKPLVNFAQSIQQDLAAVAASLTFRWSNGPVEGHVNRLKLIKRQMYGRAGFDLLRKRVLEST